MKNLIIYHFEDNDGVCSCALIKDWLNQHQETDIDLLPSNYASLAKLVEDNDFDEYFDQYDCVWMTDVSFNDWTWMKKLYDKFGHNFIWFDHHAPIINDSVEHKFDGAPGFRDIKRSAILCVYHYFYDMDDKEYNAGTVPTLLRLLSAWDCWSWVREGLDENFIRAFNSGVTVKGELDVDFFINSMTAFLHPGRHENNGKYPGDDVVQYVIDSFVSIGQEIIDRQDRANEALITGYGEEGWSVGGEKNAVMIVTSGPTNSQMFKCVADRLDHGIVFKHSKEGKWLVSLYNTRNDVDFDCGAYLREKYNGGGHVGAAGCTLNDTQFFKVIWERSL